MKPFAITLMSVSLMFSGSFTWAGGIIGSVDKSGNVTFSDRVPADAVKSKEVRVDPVYPSQQSQKAARATTQQMLDAADQSREGVENARAARQQQVSKRRSRMEAEQQRLQEVTAMPARDGYVIDAQGSAPEYIEKLPQAGSEAGTVSQEELR